MDNLQAIGRLEARLTAFSNSQASVCPFIIITTFSDICISGNANVGGR